MSKKEDEKEITDDTTNDVDTDPGTAQTAPTSVDTGTEAPATTGGQPAPAAIAPPEEDATQEPKEAEIPATPAPVQARPEGIPPPPVHPDNEPANDANTVDVIGALPPAENALQRTAESMSVGNDMATGQIHPKTYSDLFDNKSTLGKIGTLFGLLVSGAGSGLAHQSNAVLDMMNKEIDRDLDAQKTNQSNRQNWFKAAMEHEKNLADIELTNAHAAAVKTGTWTKSLEGEYQEYLNKTLPGIQRLSVSANTKANMLNGFLQQQQAAINRLAEGPAKAAQQATLDQKVKPWVAQQVALVQQDYAHKKGLVDAIHPNPLKKALQPPNPRGDVVDQGLLNEGVRLGKVMPQHPMAIAPGVAPQVNQEAGNLKNNRNNYASWLDTYNNLANVAHGGQVPGARVLGSMASGIGQLGGTLLGALTGGPIGAAVGSGLGGVGGHSAGELQNAFERYRNTQIGSLVKKTGLSEQELESILPAWTDFADEKSKKASYDKGTDYFKTNPAETTQTLDNFPGLKKPFPEVPYPSVKKKKQ